MALEFYSSIDLNKNELQNAVVQNAGSAPGSPAEGQIYYDSTSGDKAIHFYNGSAWIRVAGQATAQTTDTIASGDFIAFSDESETGDINNKLTVDNLFKTAPALLSTAAVANGDFIMFLDGGATGETKLEALADVATLFAGAGMTSGSSVVNVIGGDGITANANDVAITAAQTTITSVINAGLTVGRDAHNLIDFGTDNQIKFKTNNETPVIIMKASGEIEATSLDISGDVDVDGTMEADAITLNGTALGSLYSPIAGGSGIVTTGALNSGSITSGFGTIDTGASAITTTGLISGGSLDIDNVLINGANIGHTDDTDLIALANGAVTVNGSLTVTGTTTTNNVETVSTSSGVIFEGSAADGHDATLLSVVADSDKTYTLPNVTGYVGLFAADPSTTTISSTPAELNILDGVTSTTAELNILDGVTSTAAELNILDGVTSTAAELNILDGVTSTAAELNILDGVTSTAAELNALDGITAVVGELNALDIGGTAVGTAVASKAVILDSNKDYTGVRHFTLSGELDAGSLDIEGDADINGTLETDALTIGGAAVLAQATASAVGAVELATAAEVLTGTDTARVVTADTLAARSVVADIVVASLTDANIVTIPHNLGTADVIVQVYDITTEANVMCDIARTTDDFSTASTSSISIDFGTAPPNDCRCLITSLKGASASGTVAYT